MELKADASQESKERAIREAVRKHYEPKKKDGDKDDAVMPASAWVKDTMDNYVVVENGDKLFAHKYTMDDDGACSLGKGVEVQVIYRQKS